MSDANIPDNVVNKGLYKRAIQAVYKRYKKPSAYRSMALQKYYVNELGGKYKDGRKSKLNTWLDESWINVKEYLQTGKKIKCGEGKDKKACRPLKKVNDNTPLTIKELVKMHGKDKLLEFAIKKEKNMDKRASWKTLKFY